MDATTTPLLLRRVTFTPAKAPLVNSSFTVPEMDPKGTGVGADVGLEVGAEVGLEVGSDVGADVGLEVGADVGTRVGAYVGDGVKRLSMKSCLVTFWPPERGTVILPSGGNKLINPGRGDWETVYVPAGRLTKT